MLKPIIAIVTCLVVIFFVWLKPDATLNQTSIALVQPSTPVLVEHSSPKQQATTNQLPAFLSNSSLNSNKHGGVNMEYHSISALFCAKCTHKVH